MRFMLTPQYNPKINYRSTSGITAYPPIIKFFIDFCQNIYRWIKEELTGPQLSIMPKWVKWVFVLCYGSSFLEHLTNKNRGLILTISFLITFIATVVKRRVKRNAKVSDEEIENFDVDLMPVHVRVSYQAVFSVIAIGLLVLGFNHWKHTLTRKHPPKEKTIHWRPIVPGLNKHFHPALIRLDFKLTYEDD